MNKREQALIRARWALEKIARRDGVSVETVRMRIQEGIISGLTNPDPEIQKEWAKIPRAGDCPTPEEVIAYYSEKF